MSEPKDELKDADFSAGRSRLGRLKHKAMELPTRLRLAGQGAWRGKERGLAVVAGVFLASLVITTVLAYGVGLVPALFRRVPQSVNRLDAKIEYARTPVENSHWLVQQHRAPWLVVCDELREEFSASSATVRLFLGRQGIHSAWLLQSSTSWSPSPLK